VPAITAILRSNRLSGLVTDEATATAILGSGPLSSQT
jgi:DNA-binding transcriptional regulator LsrR (DeoR family)